MFALQKIANDHKILLLSDSAQSHGATLRQKSTGALCAASAFSFYPSKNLGGLGESGAVVTTDEKIADRVRILRNYGSRVRYHNEVKGVNERMDPLQAAFLKVKLEKLPEWNARRREIAKLYLSKLSSVEWLTLPVSLPDSDPCWHLFVIGCGDNERRDAVQAHLKKCGVDALIHYPIPPHLSEAYQELGYKEGSFPITERLAKVSLSIPICPMMTDAMVEKVVESIKSFGK